jgi:hypothetical protein
MREEKASQGMTPPKEILTTIHSQTSWINKKKKISLIRMKLR